MQLLLYEQESIIKWLTIIVCLCLYKCLLKKLVWKRLLHQKNIPFRNCSETPQEAPFANRPPLTYHWCTIVKVTCAYSHFHLAPESIQILVMCWYLGPEFWNCGHDTGILCSCGDLNAVRSSIYGKPRPSNYDSQKKHDPGWTVQLYITFTLFFHWVKDATSREKLLIQPWAFDFRPRLETHETAHYVRMVTFTHMIFVDVFYIFLGYLQVSWPQNDNAKVMVRFKNLAQAGLW